MVIEKAVFNLTFAGKKDMKLFYTLLIAGIASLLLVSSGTFTNQITLRIHADSFVNDLAKHQLFALLVAILSTTAILVLNPGSKQFLSPGKLNILAEKEMWLGINGKTSWKINGLQLLFFVSIPTAIFMFLAVKSSNSMGNFRWSLIPFILVFSLTNSLAEELIFRFGIIGGLFNRYPKQLMLLLSAVFFGIPHYFGSPSGFTGVLMAGILGYILCKATFETKGLLVAWAIHFVQDAIIFTALIMMQVKQFS